jgi:alanine racemase
VALIKISRENFFYNLDIVKNQVEKKDKIAVVLKDNAYGHGIKKIAKLSKEYGVKTSIVRTIKEAKQVLKFFDRVLVLCDIPQKELSKKIHITINSLNDINKIPPNTSVELKVNSGMNRNGIEVDDISKALKMIQKKSLDLKGVFTHYSCADEDNTLLFTQAKKFELIKRVVKKETKKLNIKTPYFHSNNSAATFRLDSSDDKFVRVGIAIYGYLDGLKTFPKLKPILSLYASKISSRVVKTDSYIGYGSSFILDGNYLVSCYDIGYGDGFLRLNENQIYYLPNGSRVLGRVSMDNISINSNENEILIFDNVTKLANIHNTIVYEILVRLNQNIKRVLI